MPGREKVVPVVGNLLLVEEEQDLWLFDTVNVRRGASSIQFFRSLNQKPDHLAKFEGDRELVPNGRFFQIEGIGTYELGGPYDDRLLRAIYDYGSFNMQIGNQDQDQDVFRRLQGGQDTTKYPGGGSNDPNLYGVVAEGDVSTVRQYEIPITAMGGRAFKIEVSWEASGGVQIPAGVTIPLQMHLAGKTLIPFGDNEQPPEDELKQRFLEQIESGGF